VTTMGVLRGEKAKEANTRKTIRRLARMRFPALEGGGLKLVPAARPCGFKRFKRQEVMTTHWRTYPGEKKN